MKEKLYEVSIKNFDEDGKLIFSYKDKNINYEEAKDIIKTFKSPYRNIGYEIKWRQQKGEE